MSVSVPVLPRRLVLGALVAMASLALLLIEAPSGFAVTASGGAVVLSAPAPGPSIATGGSNSASSGLSACPSGTAMVGAQTMTTQSPDTSFIDYPYKLTATCAALKATTLAVVPSATTVAGSVMQGCTDAQCGLTNGKPSIAASVSCPAGQVVTQFETVSGLWTDDFILGCQALGADGAPTGAVTWLSRLGGNHNPNQPSAPALCPTRSVAVGLGALTGDNYFETPYLNCAAVTVNETVTFASQGGSAVPSQTVVYGAAAKKPAAPTKHGYTFAGWFTAASGGAAYVFSTQVHAGETLYAHWTAVPVKHKRHPVGPSVDTGAQLVAAGSGHGPSWPLEVGLAGAAMVLLVAAARLARRS